MNEWIDDYVIVGLCLFRIFHSICSLYITLVVYIIWVDCKPIVKVMIQ